MNNDTPFHRITLDVDQPLPAVQVPVGHYGLGVYLRREGRPIGYFHHYTAPGTRYSATGLGKLILDRAGSDIVRSSLRTAPEASAAKPRLTIAICTKDRAWSLRPCLDSLTPLQFPEGKNEPEFEILVVDNAPTDTSTRDLVEAQRAVTYAVEPLAGLDFARNTAVRRATGDYIAFMDDDVLADPAWFEGLGRALAKNPDAGAVTGPVMPMELASRAQVLFEDRGGFSHGFGTVRHTQHDRAAVTHPCNAGTFGAGCNMVFSRQLLLRIGLFDEALDTGRPLPGGGDLDIFYRVLRADKPLIYEGSMAVYHRHRRDYEGLRRQMWTWGLGFMAFVAKTWQTDAASRFKLRVMVLGFFRYITAMAVRTTLGRYQHPWSPDLAIWEAVGAIQGLCGEYGRSQRRSQAIRESHV
jgi:glycosyltransferase involved in cell wall biosynthesis